MNRNSLPRWVNRAVDSIADNPTGVLGRIAARRLGLPAPAGTVQVSSFEDCPKKVLIAPVNYSGQGTAWARALEQQSSEVSARSMAIEVPGGFSFTTDLEVPVGTYHNDGDWQRRQFEAATNATHVIIEAEEPPFGRLFGRSLRRQAQALRERGVSVAHMSHGTDVRLPSRHAELNEWSYYRDPSVYLPRLESLARRNIEYLLESDTPLFVSTPDLLLDLPDASWCPVVVEPLRWAVARERTDPRGPLRVAHAPSNPVLKGTPLILPLLERLEAEGVIQLRLITGVPSAAMPAALANADVLLDQFRLGSYGVAACEAMAAGCVVVGQVSAQTREMVRLLSERELPIVEGDPSSLESVLRALAAEPSLMPQRTAGIDFVRAVHDGRRSGEVLLSGFVNGGAE